MGSLERMPCLSRKLLSVEFKDCLLAIGGLQTADQLGVDLGSCSTPFLDMSHFPQKRQIEFSLQHISNLPPWTAATSTAEKSSGDRFIIERLSGTPYVQGDYKAVNLKGAMDFAVSAVLRDSMWVNSFFVFVSDKNRWHKLYLAGCSGLVFKQILNNSIRNGMGDDTKNLWGNRHCVQSKSYRPISCAERN